MNIQKGPQNLVKMLCFSVILNLSVGGSAVEADVGQIKLYKEAFPEAKPKCLFCHLDAIPKKGEGMHEPNAYGLKVKEIAKVPTAETYKEIGTVEDFQAHMAGEAVAEEKMAEEVEAVEENVAQAACDEDDEGCVNLKVKEE
jgi:hypothetical protein